MNRDRTNTLLIRTPEGIVFPLPLAGPVTRCLACVVDMVCISVISTMISLVLALLAVIRYDWARAAQMLAYFLVSVGYGITSEWYFRGQTIGKRLFHLRVMDEQGLRLQFSQVVVRNLLRIVDMQPLFYLVGGVACLASRRAQRLGDVAANTIVVRQPKLVEPDIGQLMAGKFNSFRTYPHLEARLRQQVSPQEAGIALQALVRRSELDAQPRVALFGAIASHFRSLVEFPQEATDGLADEQYVRNVVDSVFRTRSTGKA